MGRNSKKRTKCKNASAASTPAHQLKALEQRAARSVLAEGDTQDADAPSSSERTRGGTGLRALIFRPGFMAARDCARLVDELRAVLATAGPQSSVFQATRGHIASHAGLSLLSAEFEQQLHASLRKLLSRRHNLDALNARYDAACPDTKRAWPDLPFNGLHLVGFGARAVNAAQGAEAKLAPVDSLRDVPGIPAVIIYLELDDAAEPLVVYPCSGHLTDPGRQCVAAAAPACVGADAGAPPVKLESWADVPAEQLRGGAESAELEALVQYYLRTDHALPAPNGHLLRVRTGQALARAHMSLLQRNYAASLHDAAAELLQLGRRRTALLMLRAVRHCELHAAQAGWRLPDPDFSGDRPRRA